MAMLRGDTVAQEEADRCVRKKRWGQGHGTIGKTQTIEDDAGHGFPGRDLLLVIGPKARVDHFHKPHVFHDALTIPTWSKRSTVTMSTLAPPLHGSESSRYAREDTSFLRYVHLLNVG